MNDNPAKHHRRSIRLKDYDYAQDGAYFVTLCTYRRKCFLADVLEDDVQLTTCGCIVEEEWSKTAIVRPYVTLDAFVIMPNHLHGIIMLMGTRDLVGATWQVAPTEIHPLDDGPTLPKGPKAGSLGAIIGQFKRSTTLRINQLREVESNAPVWQRSYYETVIRNEYMLTTKRRYIATNPARWASDEDNPVNLR